MSNSYVPVAGKEEHESILNANEKDTESLAIQFNISKSRVLNCFCENICILYLLLATSLVVVLFRFYSNNDNPLKVQSAYDYIIVGAGPAGSILTRKLVDSGARVLLLEAGIATQHALGG